MKTEFKRKEGKAQNNWKTVSSSRTGARFKAGNFPAPPASVLFSLQMPPFLCIGHRGAAGHEPENTLRSIRRALEMGADGVEIDVRLSKDGALVVIHDATLRRTTGTAGAVSRKSLAEIQALDAGRGERIPVLREVFRLVRGRAFLNVEIKARGAARAIAAETAAAVKSGDGWIFENIIVSSFDHRELAALPDSRIRIGALINRRPLSMQKMVARLRASYVNIPARLATARLVQKIHAAGAKALVFTVNEPEEIARLRNLGADGIFTDFPDRAVEKHS